jgi:hypothetical protein
VYGLPAEPGLLGWLLLALGGAAAAAGMRPLLVWSRRDLRGASESGAVALALAATFAAAPFVLWRVVEDIRVTTGLSDYEAANIGITINELDSGIFDRLRERIPPGDTYAVRAGPAVGPTTPAAVEAWAGYVLLPRIRLDDSRRARWVVVWGAHPRELGIRFTSVSRVPGRDLVYLARVQP